MDAFHIVLHACSNTFLATTCTFKHCLYFLPFYLKMAISCIRSRQKTFYLILTKKCNCTMYPCRSLIYFVAEACLDISISPLSWQAKLPTRHILTGQEQGRSRQASLLQFRSRDVVGRLAYCSSGAGTQ